MRFSLLLLTLGLVALGQVSPTNLYGPFEAKVDGVGAVKLSTGHRIVLAGVELPAWEEGSLAKEQARRRGLSLSTVVGRGKEALLCLQGLLGGETFLELENPERLSGYLYIRWNNQSPYTRPSFTYESLRLDQVNYLLVRRGCAWATGEGRYAPLLLKAQEEAKTDGIGVWRP